MALITSDCDAMRCPSIKWPESPRAARPPGDSPAAPAPVPAAGTPPAVSAYSPFDGDGWVWPYSYNPYGEPLLQLRANTEWVLQA